MRTNAPPRPRTKPPEARRGELMNAAQRLFLRHGVGPATIEQITEGAGVAKGTFYLHFTSKEHILAALRDRFALELHAGIEAAVARRPAGDWPGKLAAWAQAAVSAYLDAIRLHDILFYGAPPPSHEGLTDNIVIDHLAALLQAGAAAGAWPAAAPRVTAVFLFSGLHGTIDAASRDKRLNRRQLTRRLELLCFGAVGLGRG
jgi:AcrR family transcriptional regulator